MKEIPFSIKSIHLAAYWNFHKKFQQIFRVIQPKYQLDKIVDQDGKTPLHYAAQNGSVQFAKIILQKGQTINAVDKYKQTALHYASRADGLKMVQFLMQRGINIDAKNLNNFNCLHIALYYSQEQIALQILKVWRPLAGISSGNIQNMNPLHIATKNGLKQATKALINLGVDTQIYCSKKQKALCLAVKKNHSQITQMLVKNGANTNIVTNQYKTPLSIAIQNKNYEIAKILLQNLKSIKQCSTVIRQNPFHTVVQEQNLEFIDLFLKNVNDQMLVKQNINGENVLAIAMRKGSLEIVERLISKKRSLIFAKNLNENSCLHHQTSNPEIIKLLIKQGANIYSCNNSGCTPLHFAIKKNSLEIVSILLKHCKNQNNYINMQNTLGWNAIHYAAINSSVTIFKQLLRSASNLNINACDRHGWKPLHYSSNCQISKLLIENGACVNATDNQNWTALHCASMNGNLELVRLLVNQGAKKEVRNYNSLTPIDLAKKQKIREILRN